MILGIAWAGQVQLNHTKRVFIMQARTNTVKKQTKGIRRLMFALWMLFLLVTVELFPRSSMNNFKSDISNSSPLSREKT